MSIKFTCDDKQTLVAYLYGEVDQATADALANPKAPVSTPSTGGQCSVPSCRCWRR